MRDCLTRLVATCPRGVGSCVQSRAARLAQLTPLPGLHSAGDMGIQPQVRGARLRIPDAAPLTRPQPERPLHPAGQQLQLAPAHRTHHRHRPLRIDRLLLQLPQALRVRRTGHPRGLPAAGPLQRRQPCFGPRHARAVPVPHERAALLLAARRRRGRVSVRRQGRAPAHHGVQARRADPRAQAGVARTRVARVFRAGEGRPFPRIHAAHGALGGTRAGRAAAVDIPALEGRLVRVDAHQGRRAGQHGRDRRRRRGGARAAAAVDAHDLGRGGREGVPRLPPPGLGPRARERAGVSLALALLHAGARRAALHVLR